MREVSTMTGRLAGKIAIITGATSGIGKATALLFAQEGASVVITGRRADLGRQLAEQITDARWAGASTWRPTTRGRPTANAWWMRPFPDSVASTSCSTTPASSPAATAETTTDEVWDQTMAINVTAVWRMSKLVIPHMKRQGGGVIVNNGSDWSVVAAADALPYITSKGAVALMTKAMAMDHARENIRVNAVCPGDTVVERWLEQGYFEGSGPVSMEEALKESAEHIPMGRYGRPEEIARAVLFLASDDSSFMTGHLLLVDGGSTAT